MSYHDILWPAAIALLSIPVAAFHTRAKHRQLSGDSGLRRLPLDFGRVLADSAPAARPWLGTADAVMLSYLAVCTLLVAMSDGSAAHRRDVMEELCLCAAAIGGAAAVARRTHALPLALRTNVYRAVFVGVVFNNYLMLRHLLPMVRADAVDASLVAADRWLLGESPAFVLQVFNRRPIVEWFAFFYFSYFVICAVYIVSQVWLERDPAHTERFAIGSLIVMNLGQLGYMLVPAFGPGKAMQASFDAPLAGGFWWGLVQRTVQAGSAMKDVFPSLHTALPLWFAGYAFSRARTDPRWRMPAVVTAFFSANIIVSTMFLRWHYAIDVAAGILLAVFGMVASSVLSRRARQRCKESGTPLAWCFER